MSLCSENTAQNQDNTARNAQNSAISCPLFLPPGRAAVTASRARSAQARQRKRRQPSHFLSHTHPLLHTICFRDMRLLNPKQVRLANDR